MIDPFAFFNQFASTSTVRESAPGVAAFSFRNRQAGHAKPGRLLPPEWRHEIEYRLAELGYGLDPAVQVRA